MTSFDWFLNALCVCFLKSKEEIIGLKWPCPAWEQGNTQKKNNYQSHNFFYNCMKKLVNRHAAASCAFKLFLCIPFEHNCEIQCMKWTCNNRIMSCTNDSCELFEKWSYQPLDEGDINGEYAGLTWPVWLVGARKHRSKMVNKFTTFLQLHEQTTNCRHLQI